MRAQGGLRRNRQGIANLTPVLATVATVALLAGCSNGSAAPSTTRASGSGTTTATSSAPTTTSTFTTGRTTTTTKGTAPTSTTSPPNPSHWTEAALLAQLVMVGGEYSDPGASAQDLVEGAGGLVFLGQPAAGTGPSLRSEMTSLLTSASVPPFMATDEEGGEIERLSNIVGALPWPRQMAEQWTPAQVTEQVAAVARGMRALGMNMDLAPVLDTASTTDTIDDENYRSFSENGAVAGEYGAAFLQGLAEGDMIGVVKHFPGLGHANGDTDEGPATDPPISQMVDDDLVPFRQTIAGGVQVVMMSNVTEPTWGSTPASLNAAAYAYLRQLGFGGVILTDSLDAGAISATGSDGAQSVVEAIDAGADMAMVTSPGDFPGALSGLEEAVSSGRLPMSQVIKSVDRIVALKNAFLPASEQITPPIWTA
jgi:beta-N-acetylhexosaminidase